MKELMKTDGIVISNLGVTITKHADGSLLFSDAFIPGVKLKDIVGGDIVIDPSVLVQLEVADWTYDSEEDLYVVDVPHDFGLIGTQKAQVLVVTMNTDYEQIIMDTVKVKENTVLLKSTEALDMFVTMKRI